MSICCRFVVQLSIGCGFVVDIWTCCGFVVQQVVQQIHNKSNKWSLSIKAYCLPLLTYYIGAIDLPASSVKDLAVCWNDCFRKNFLDTNDMNL